MIQQVGFKYRGAGAWSIRGWCLLSPFIAMNSETHAKAFLDKIFAEARGRGPESDKHNVSMTNTWPSWDMTAEFYLRPSSASSREREIAQNEFTVHGKKVDIGKITNVAVMTVEGANDDISAPANASPRSTSAPACPRTRRPSTWNPAPPLRHLRRQSWRPTSARLF